MFDTNVYIDEWRHGRHSEAIATLAQAFVVRHSAVVLSELRRGVRDRQSARLVDRLHALAHTVWEPTAEDWWEAGRLIRTIGEAHHFDRAKRRDFQNDALIALTARRHGAVVVTTDARDLGLLGAVLRIRVLNIRQLARVGEGTRA